VPQVAGASQILLVDGVEVGRTPLGSLAQAASLPGVYRLEVRLDHPAVARFFGVPWILSNASVLGAAPMPAVSPTLPPAERLLLWPGDGDVQTEQEGVDRCERMAGGDAIALHFRLGADGGGGFCALADRRLRDLSAFH